MENFKKAANLWLESKRDKVRASSYVQYDSIVRNRLVPFFGKDAVEDITKERTSEFISAFEMRFKPNTMRLAFAVLSSIMRSRGGIMPQDALKGLKREQRFINTLTKEECGRFSRELSSDGNLKSVGILLALNTGLRIGEVCALKWGDFDFVKSSFCVRGTMSRTKMPNDRKTSEVIVTPPKTFSSLREIPVSEPMIRILRPLRKDSKAFLLTGEKDRFVEPRNLERYFSKKSQQILKRKVKFHDLRHTFATLAISAGIDVKTMSELLGHSNVLTTMNFYRAVGFDDKRKAVRLIAKVIASK